MTPQKKYYKSKFDTCAKVRKKQLLWLKENKGKNGCRTVAGFLDKIINQYKTPHNE